jgi:DNA invertase Pin-like site-specific DNA recombinase
MRSHSTPAVAYSYVRFSSPPQAHGDSLRRQTEAAHAWCEKNQVHLDETLTFRDLGKSAFLGEHRKNPDRHALAAFLKLVQDGRVTRGSYLVIESLDRLTREHVRAGLMLLLGLIEAGVRIVQLSPSELVYDEKSEEMGLMLAIVELSRGHRESKRKSDLIKASWDMRKRNAREKKQPHKGHLPAWVECQDGKLKLIPERAAVVKRLFRLTIDGYGLVSIIHKFEEEKIPPFGPVVIRDGRKRSQFCGRWQRAYLSKILRDRRAVGEFQPCRREGHKKIPDGDPISGYFPAVVTEDEFHAARAAATQRRMKPGRVGTHVNIFAGLIRHARDGDTYFAMTEVGGRPSRTKPPTPRRVLINSRSAEGLAPYYSFPLTVFETAIHSCLREIDPHEILNGDSGPDESLVLAGELARVETKIGELEAELLNGDVAAVVKVLRKLEDQKRDLAARLSQARQKAAHPLSEAWGDCQSLLSVLGVAEDQNDARLRLRSSLRRVVDSIWLLVVPRGRCRLAAVQVWFAERDRHRDYLIFYRAAFASRHARRPTQWQVLSLADAEALGPLDLRNRSDAKKLEKALARLDLDVLTSG